MTWSVLAMVAMVAQFLHHRSVYQNVQLEQGQLVIWIVSAGCFLALLLLFTTPSFMCRVLDYILKRSRLSVCVLCACSMGCVYMFIVVWAMHIMHGYSGIFLMLH